MRKMSEVVRTWVKAFSAVKQYPVMIFPFAIAAVIDCMVLALLFFAPQEPLVTVFGPVIRVFWGEEYLHYPFNLALLPRLFSYGKECTVLVIGMLLTAIATGMMYQAARGVSVRPWVVMERSIRKYIPLALVWVGVLLITYVSFKGASFLGRNGGLSSQSLFVLSAIVALSIEMVLMYCLPLIVVEKRGVLSSGYRALRMVRKYFLESFLMVLVPNLIVLPVMAAYAKLPFLSELLFPEIVLVVLLLRIVMLTVADFIITASGTMFLVNQGELSACAVRKSGRT